MCVCPPPLPPAAGQQRSLGVQSGGWKAGLDGAPRPGHIVPRGHGPGPGRLPGDVSPPYDNSAGVREPEWSCTLISIILALNDIGPGDGATVLVPVSARRQTGLRFALQPCTGSDASRRSSSLTCFALSGLPQGVCVSSSTRAPTRCVRVDHKVCVCAQAVFEHPGHLEQGGGMVAEGSLVEAAEEMHLKAGDGALSA